MPAVLNICLIIYWNVNVLWIIMAMQDQVCISLPFQRVTLGFLVIVIIEAFTVNIHQSRVSALKHDLACEPKGHVIERPFCIDAFP